MPSSDAGTAALADDGPLPARQPLRAIGLLFLMQGLTGQFIVQAIPLFLREAGHGPAVLGLIYIAALPYVLRFLWAPLVDRFDSVAFGRRRGWVVAMQGVVLALLGVLATLDPAGAPLAVIAVAALLMIALGTQLTAAGALMIELFKTADYPRVAAVQAASAGLAGLVLGAGVLYLLGDLGWRMTVFGLIALSSAVFALVLTEPFDRGRRAAGGPTPFFSQLAMFRDKRLRSVLWVAIAVGLGVALPYGMKTILQIDAGMDISEIGLVGIVGGNAVGFLAALGVSPLVKRYGGLRCLVALAMLSAALCLTVALALAAARPEKWLAILYVLAGSGIAYASFTAERSLAMPLCGREQTATRFATFVSLDSAAVLVCAAIGNNLAQATSVATVFAVAAMASLGGAVFAMSVARRWEAMR